MRESYVVCCTTAFLNLTQKRKTHPIPLRESKKWGSLGKYGSFLLLEKKLSTCFEARVLGLTLLKWSLRGNGTKKWLITMATGNMKSLIFFELHKL